MVKTMIRTALAVLLAGTSVFAATLAQAQAWPVKPIRVIIPYPPGGGPDVVMRPLGEKLREVFGQNIVLEHKPGASTIIGSDYLAKSAPDGYTLLLITDSHSLNPGFRNNLPYDSLRDFAPITQLVNTPLVMVTRPSVPVKNVAELIAYAKANPNKVAYGSPGFGGPHYVAMEWFKKMAGVDMLHVPYQGSSGMFPAMLAGDIQVMLIGAVTALPYAKDGRVNLIAAAPNKRLAAAPDTPSIAETPGMSEFSVMSWYGLVAPAKTPPAIITRLNQEIRKALAAPDLAQKLSGAGLFPAGASVEEFQAFMRKDGEHYGRIIKLTGARGE